MTLAPSSCLFVDHVCVCLCKIRYGCFKERRIPLFPPMINLSNYLTFIYDVHKKNTQKFDPFFPQASKNARRIYRSIKVTIVTAWPRYWHLIRLLFEVEILKLFSFYFSYILLWPLFHPAKNNLLLAILTDRLRSIFWPFYTSVDVCSNRKRLRRKKVFLQSSNYLSSWRNLHFYPLHVNLNNLYL